MGRGMTEPDQACKMFPIASAAAMQSRSLQRGPITPEGVSADEALRGINEGVVGEQPLLQPGQSHDYVSGCPLTTPFGSMEGFYTFECADGTPTEVRIPFFPLAAPETAEGRSPR